MKTLFVLAGNFGVGKSSIVNAYEHKPVSGLPFSEVEGLLSLGGKRGADVLNGLGYDKRRVYTEVLPKVEHRDILVHSVFYQNIQDIERYTRTHNVVVISLNTSYKDNGLRILNRSNGRKQINRKTYDTYLKNTDRLKQFCQFKKVPFYDVDNDRPMREVAQSVWAIIRQERR